MGKIYTKEEFLEFYKENLIKDPGAHYEFDYKGKKFMILPCGVLEHEDGQYSNGIQDLMCKEYKLLLKGKVGDPFWVLYNFMIDGKPFIERIEECILEAYWYY